MKTNKEINTRYGYKFTINKGINLLTDEIKEYLHNFNPTLFFNDIDSFHYFIDQKVNNTDIWIESRKINFDNNEIEINLYK